MERRAYPRIDTRLRCELERAERVYEGYTVNLSRTGALIELSGTIPGMAAGDHVILRIAMPERPLFEPKCMECSGVVCRAKETEDGFAVALLIEAVRFQSAEKMLMRTLRQQTSLINSHVH